MKWTRTRPTMAGWHWFRPGRDWKPPIDGLLLRPDAPPSIVFVGHHAVGLVVRFPQGMIEVEDMEGHWSSVIEEPLDE